MEIWNSRFDNSTYSDFEIKYGSLFEVNLGQAIYRFEAWEVGV